MSGTTANGFPYVTPDDHPKEYPAASQQLAEKIDTTQAAQDAAITAAGTARRSGLRGHKSLTGTLFPGTVIVYNLLEFHEGNQGAPVPAGGQIPVNAGLWLISWGGIPDTATLMLARFANPGWAGIIGCSGSSSYLYRVTTSDTLALFLTAGTLANNNDFSWFHATRIGN